jgi:diaminopimelate epimerase
MVKIVAEIGFWKMHGLGNDYVVIDNMDGKLDGEDLGKLAERICRRRFSVGADGLLLLCASSVADVKMRILNADGSEAEMCGNGIRCLAKFCFERKVTEKRELMIETLAGVKRVWLEVEDGIVRSVTVDMGSPDFERRRIPMTGEGRCIDEELAVGDERFRVTCLSVGNPHCVVFVEDLEAFPVRRVGPLIEVHPAFPNRTNVEFVQIIGNDELRVRVWERGVGETLACGTGACAAVLAASVLGKTGSRCTVHLPGGDLEIKYEDDRILMSGPAEKSFVGVLEV